MRMRSMILALSLAVSGATPAWAGDAGDPVAGKAAAFDCSSCHGMDGNSIDPTFPRLAGQQPAYLEAQLKAFRDHSRADPHAQGFMWGMASMLSDTTIRDLAAYFASQTPRPNPVGSSPLLADGKRMFEEGIASKNVAPCATCHAANGQGLGAFPRVAGQHADYSLREMFDFQRGFRKNVQMETMTAPMTVEEMRAAAIYFQSLH